LLPAACRDYDVLRGAAKMAVLHFRSANLSTTAANLDQHHGAAAYEACDAIVAVDEQQRIVIFNAAAERMFGYSAAEALGSPLSRLIPPDRREAHARHLGDFDRSGRAEARMGERGFVTALRANGERFAAEASISRAEFAGAPGRGRVFIALLRDLELEQGLQQQVDLLNRRIRAVFELAPVAIWITDAERIVFANHACAALFGANHRKVLIGRSIYELLASKSHDAVRQTVTQALQGAAKASTVQETIARLDGQQRDVIIAIAGLPDHGRTVVQMVITDISEREHENRELERSRRSLRSLSSNMVQAREDERRRIARELHDELGQRLTALKMELATLNVDAPESAPAGRIGAMLEMVDDTVATVRRIATELRPLMLDDLGLNAAIEWLADSWSRRMGVAVTLHLEATDLPIGDAGRIALYRMVQEALTNIARHARATKVCIEVQQSGGDLLLTVLDNGVGFDEASMFREGSHGLLGIRERALMLDGELTIGNSPSGGGRVTVRLPFQADALKDRPPPAPVEPPAVAAVRRRRATKDKT
jgi:two-component system sensor histidine kinase UhpB